MECVYNLNTVAFYFWGKGASFQKFEDNNLLHNFFIT